MDTERTSPMKKPSYFVMNENTLGYIFEEQPQNFNILSSKPQKGGHDPMNGYVAIGSTDKLRTATAEDFEYYRVSTKGHLD